MGGYVLGGAQTYDLLRIVADGFDVVAVGVAYEHSVVVGVVLGPEARFVQHLRADRLRRGKKCSDRSATCRTESDVSFAKAFSCCLWADPEVRPRRVAITDDRAEVHDPCTAERREHGIVELCARGYVSALDRDMIEHAAILAQRSPDALAATRSIMQFCAASSTGAARLPLHFPGRLARRTGTVPPVSSWTQYSPSLARRLLSPPVEY
jgi:hypothetical protein